MKLYKKIIIEGTLTALTGMHIGDSKETVEIGGVDSPVVRRRDNKEPYIPGSSIKGKLRSLLEISHGQEHTFNSPEHKIGKFFGALGKGKDSVGVPSRLLVRDAFLTQESKIKLQDAPNLDLPFTEVKTENVINRISGQAEHPRQIERVPAGTAFSVQFVINIIANSDAEAAAAEQEYLQIFYAGIKLLTDDYLGGSGSRGYGQVSFNLEQPTHKPINEYLNA